MKYRTDSDKFSVVSAFEAREFQRVYDDSYDIYWAPISAVYPFYMSHSKAFISHFPAFHELTRKDLLYQHIKRFKRKNPALFVDFPMIPLTYQLPHEASILAREITLMFPLILKPAGRGQGKGITIANDLEQYKKWQREHGDELYLASRYINNPLLVQGRKFDLRIYVLVTSFYPLRCFIYQKAFCRFCANHYDYDFGDLQAHLTNVAINQPFDTGTKMSLENLLLYLKSRHSPETVIGLYQKITKLIVLTLYSVKEHIGYARNAFELYGFDVLIDADFQTWLMEVNACPSLSVSSDEDRILKCGLLDDILRVVLKEGGTGDFLPVEC